MKSNTQFQIPDSQSGQTIIETLAAIFILVTTLTVGLGLATYVLSNSKNSMNEVIAINLARQGIEQIRMMRDSNWLAGEATTAGGFDLVLCADIGLNCYPSVFMGGVNGGPTHRTSFDLSTPTQAVCDYSSTNCSAILAIQHVLSRYSSNPVDMFAVSSPPVAPVYYLYLNQTDGSYNPTLPAGCSNPANCPPDFLRKVKLSRINIAPYTNSNSNWLTVVNVYVAWPGRRCTPLANADPETLSTPCKIVLEERLTNWKDYR